ncbi:MAG: M16 family metallopeptidase [Christensenellales bacterium]
MNEMQIVKLNNGATFIYQHQNLNNTTQAVIGFKTGSRCDGDIPGMTHLMEHLWFSGNEKYSDKEMFKFDKTTNTKHGATTSNDFVHMSLDCVTENLDKALEYYAEAILNCDYTKERIDQEIEVISEEILLSESNNVGINYALGMINEAYDSSKIVGTKDNLKQISPEMIKNYAQSLFIAENLIISVVTNLTLDEALNKFNKSKISSIPSKRENEVPFIIPKKYNNCDSYFITYSYGVPNISLNVLVTAKYINSLEYLPEVDLDILRQFEQIKFNDFSGKLYTKMRLDKQLAYSSYFNYMNSPDTITSIFNVETSPLKLNDCMLAVADCIREARVEGITEQDFNDVIEIYKSSLSREYNENIHCGDANFNVDIVMKNEFVYPTKDIINRLNLMGIGYYNRLFKEIYSQNNLILCVSGDFALPNMASINQLKEWAFNDNPNRSLISYESIMDDETSKNALIDVLNYYYAVNTPAKLTIKEKLNNIIKKKSKQNDYERCL